MRKISDAEVRERLVAGDCFYSNTCYRCTLRGAAFILRDSMVGVCPRCVQERIRMLEAELGGLPPDIEAFRKEAVREVACQERREKLALSVDWNYVWKCRRCGHLVRKPEVRLVPAEEGEAFTHHRVCYACYLVRLEEERVRQGAAFDESDPFQEGKSYNGLRPTRVSVW